MTREEIIKLIPTIPESPGCYQYFNRDGEVIYVGKAINLRRRVASYFNKEHIDTKTRKLVASIHDLKYYVVENESDALLLENNLIKTYSPKYNILLKDGSSYPYIAITREEYPKIILTRNADKRKQRLYGPFTDVHLAKKILYMIRGIFFIRTCNLPLTQEKIEKGKFSTCLQYHIKKCKAPCANYISREEYRILVQEAEEVIKGNIKELTEKEEQLMLQESENLRFELAAQHKAKIEILAHYRSKHSVAQPSIGNLTVFGFIDSATTLCMCMLQVREGSIIRIITDAWKKTIADEIDELAASIITDILEKYPFNSEEILVSIPIPWNTAGKNHTKIATPQRGEKKALVNIAVKNAEKFLKDRESREEKLNPEQRATKLLTTMMKDLNLPKPPRHIDCFDNSNIQGTNPVAACVVFINGKPAKQEYRKFHVKTVVGANDYASMKEIVTRRYERLIEANAPLPDLIVIDGGKGQLHFACEALKALNLLGKIPIIALAERLEEIYFPGEHESHYLKRNSETLNVLRHIRDEAHRFGITFHRQLRSKKQIKSELDEIPGVGDKTKSKLLKHFGSTAEVKRAKKRELEELLGTKRGKQIYEYLHAKDVINNLITQIPE